MYILIYISNTLESKHTLEKKFHSFPNSNTSLKKVKLQKGWNFKEEKEMLL